MNQKNISDFSQFNNSWYKPGKNLIIRTLWYLINLFIFNNAVFPISSIKVLLLRLFGAKVGKKVVIKPSVNIKYPWRLTIGNHVWIGENVWIDSLGDILIGNNCCISQGAMLLCGNHNYNKPTFDLMVGEIILEDGVWIGAKSIVCPGVRCQSHSVLSAGSVATSLLEPYGIYQGNPAVKIKERKIIENQ